uniref:DNA-directed RNA polymerase n=1 Tax=Dikerogammarus haemobaphes virus 1 TaxID=2704946 RepID=A0A6G9HE99_9VIRU|nr:DNA-dependent RNA polymerase subunit RPB1 [Dikerogammarus haemobaphes virus 1]
MDSGRSRFCFSVYTEAEIKNLVNFSNISTKKNYDNVKCLDCFSDECLGEFSVIRLKHCFIYNTTNFSYINNIFKNICFICRRVVCLCKKKKIYSLKKYSDGEHIFKWNDILLTGLDCFKISRSNKLKKYLFNFLIVPPIELLTEHLHKFRVLCKTILRLCDKVSNNSKIIDIYNSMLHSSNYKDISLKKLLNSKEGLVGRNIIGKRSFYTMRAVITSHNSNLDTVYISECIYRILKQSGFKFNKKKIILNRQPSLRMESMIALKYKTIECQCKYNKYCTFPVIKLPIYIITPLNADFDGDECNVHFPLEDTNIDNMDVKNYIIDSQNNDVLIGPIFELMDFIYHYFTVVCCTINSYEIGYKKFPPEFLNNWELVNGSISVFKCAKALFSYVLLNSSDNYETQFLKIKRGIVVHDSIFNKETLGKGYNSFIYFYLKKYGNSAVLELYEKLNNLLTMFLETYPRPSLQYNNLKKFKRTKDLKTFDGFLNSGGKLKTEHVYQAVVNINIPENINKPITPSDTGPNYFDGLNLTDIFNIGSKNRQSLIDSSNSKIADSGFITKKILKVLEHVFYEKGIVFDDDTGRNILIAPGLEEKYRKEDWENRFINIGTISTLCITEYFSQMYLKSGNSSNPSYHKEVNKNNFSLLKGLFYTENKIIRDGSVTYKLSKKQCNDLEKNKFDFFIYYLIYGVTFHVENVIDRLSTVMDSLNRIHIRILVYTIYQSGCNDKKMTPFQKFFFNSQYQSIIHLARENFIAPHTNVHDTVTMYTGLGLKERNPARR